jgi:hypothetical protein
MPTLVIINEFCIISFTSWQKQQQQQARRRVEKWSRSSNKHLLDEIIQNEIQIK